MCVSLGGFLGYQQIGWLIHAEAVPSEKTTCMLGGQAYSSTFGESGTNVICQDWVALLWYSERSALC